MADDAGRLPTSSLPSGRTIFTTGHKVFQAAQHIYGTASNPSLPWKTSFPTLCVSFPLLILLTKMVFYQSHICISEIKMTALEYLQTCSFIICTVFNVIFTRDTILTLQGEVRGWSSCPTAGRDSVFCSRELQLSSCLLCLGRIAVKRLNMALPMGLWLVILKQRNCIFCLS